MLSGADIGFSRKGDGGFSEIDFPKNKQFKKKIGQKCRFCTRFGKFRLKKIVFSERSPSKFVFIGAESGWSKMDFVK